ncbi:MAG: glycolate oxidase subunit GlcF [Gammaproteobacteria bacterium]|nr:glycolate oxidase subunit GlcF [Gammaproteobacteria bacterium]
MQTQLPESLLATDRGQRAQTILRSCVHCGFCNATCPTYQLFGDELDGPRGRIYQIKSFLETGEATLRINTHLDRCLTCRSCETTCPSGVAYGELLEIARESLPDDRVWWRRLLIWGLKAVVPRRQLLRPVAALGNLMKPLLPGSLAQKVPPMRVADPLRLGTHPRKVIVLQGCVQSVSTPEVNTHLARLLDARGIEVLDVRAETCCGSLALHLGDEPAAIGAMVGNVRALAGYLDSVEAVISTASGCGVTVQDYGRHLAGTAEAAEAESVAKKTLDVATFLAQSGLRFNRSREEKRIAWHTPCTLQHGQRSRGVVEGLLRAAGYELTPVADPHLCCGSAGTYSILQPDTAQALRDRKLDSLEGGNPELIATANIGCQLHLASAAGVPVVHWLQLLK